MNPHLTARFANLQAPLCRPHKIGDSIAFRVWAPFAKRVDLVLYQSGLQSNVENVVEAVEIAMERDRDGYFLTLVKDYLPDQRYAYRIDQGPPRPDPCSVWQAEGVHHASTIYFPEEYSWTDTDWVPIPREQLVFYEIHIGTFTAEGTFEAVIPRLAQLKELGITAIEIMPVAQFPGKRNWGYDGVQLFAAQNSYGGPVGLQKLVDAAHQAGIAVFLDVVYNHFGPEGNYISEFGPYYSNRYRTPWGPAFNFDDRFSDPVRSFVLDNVDFWIRHFHLDGLRLDAVHAMYDTSPVHILQEVKETADRAAQTSSRTATIVVESLLNDVKMIMPPERGGYGCDAEWNEDFHHAIIAYLVGERHGKYIDFGAADSIRKVVAETFLHQGNYSQFRGRRWGGRAGDRPGDQFVIGVHNHDHIGNRAFGERLSHLAEPAVQRLAASLMFLSPHLPLLFMGEEYAEQNTFQFFCSFEDQGLIESVRSGRKRDYDLEGEIPDPQSEAAFTSSRLSWSWPEGSPQAGMRALYQDLIAVRTDWPALKNFTERSAKLWPIPTPENSSDQVDGGILELVRGGLQPKTSSTITCYFNLGSTLERIPESRLPDQVILFRSERKRYQGVIPQQTYDDDALGPFECVVFGPKNYRSLVQIE